MLNGRWRGEEIGSGTHVWKFDDMVRTGEMSQADLIDAEACMSRSVGHCMTMGTASTMASMVESLGMGLPSNAAIPAADSRRNVLAHMAGRRIVEMVGEDLKMSKILTKQAFENAVMTNGAIGGSTNAVIHLIAVAGRLGVDLSLDDWDRLGRELPCLVNLMPSGKYLMEDFYYAGGLPVVLRELGDAGLLHKDRADRQRPEHLDQRQGRHLLPARCDPQFRQALQGQRRRGRAARQPGAVGFDPEALGGDAGADAAPRTRCGLRGYRPLQGAGRRPGPGTSIPAA